MATLNKQQGKELHQLKLKLTKDPRATTVKIPTPTKHFPGKPGSTSSTNSPNAPAAKVLKLSDVLSLPITNPETLASGKLTTKSLTAITQLPSAAVQPPAVKSPKQQTVLMSEPVVVPVVVPTKSPRKKQTMLVIPPQLKQAKQQLSLTSPVVVKSPKIKQHVNVGETSTKLKPPPLKLVIHSEPKRQSKKSQTILPTYRVRTIMKTNIKSSTSDGPLNIGQDSVAVVSKATVSTLGSQIPVQPVVYDIHAYGCL